MHCRIWIKQPHATHQLQPQRPLWQSLERERQFWTINFQEFLGFFPPLPYTPPRKSADCLSCSFWWSNAEILCDLPLPKSNSVSPLGSCPGDTHGMCSTLRLWGAQGFVPFCWWLKPTLLQINAPGPHHLQEHTKFHLKLKKAQFVFKGFLCNGGPGTQPIFTEIFPQSQIPLSVHTVWFGAGEGLELGWKTCSSISLYHLGRSEIKLKWWLMRIFDGFWWLWYNNWLQMYGFKAVWWDLPSCLLYLFYSYLKCLL